MKIDVTPTVRRANEKQRIYMELYNIKNLYFVEAADGYQYTVEFTPEKLESFLPNENVSDFLSNAMDSISRAHKFWTYGATTGNHPRWKNAIYDDNDAIIGYEPRKITSSKEFWQKHADSLAPRLEGLRFIKITW